MKITQRLQMELKELTNKKSELTNSLAIYKIKLEENKNNPDITVGELNDLVSNVRSLKNMLEEHESVIHGFLMTTMIVIEVESQEIV